MRKVKLKKRKYLGEGYWHYFRHNETGDVIREACTKAEYKRMGEKGGSKYNPTKEGYTWFQSVGGAIDVDTPSKELMKNEYTVVNGKAHVWVDGFLKKNIPLSEIVNDELTIHD